MATERVSEVLSDEKISLYKRGFSSSDVDKFLYLYLGIKPGFTSSYPLLRFEENRAGEIILEAYDLATDRPGCAYSRQPKNEELAIFVQIAKALAHDSLMTTKLAEKAKDILNSRKSELLNQIDSIDSIVKIIGE
jgi:hypothetical protein